MKSSEWREAADTRVTCLTFVADTGDLCELNTAVSTVFSLSRGRPPPHTHTFPGSVLRPMALS